MEITLKETANMEQYLSQLLDEHRGTPQQSDTEHFSFALYYGEKCIGGLTAKLFQGEFYISLLAVDKNYRGQGLGTRLMLAAEEKANEHNAQHLLLTTYSYQGVDFYLKMGFEQLGKISNYPVERVDKIYFIKYLTGK